MEIERKFLVAPCEAFDMIKDVKPLNITQGYLNNMKDEWLIRYRSIDNKEFIMELKSKGMLSRQELSYPITSETFWEGIHLCPLKLKKKRYVIITDRHTYEVDVYQGHDFITVEVEFDTEGEADFFDVPWWFGKEVTHDPAYKNVNLCTDLNLDQ
jgi:adenylate cyclase